jgi:hypothetical protein
MSTETFERIPRNGRTTREAAELTGLSFRTPALTSEPREVYLARADEKRTQVLKLRAKGLMRAIAENGCSVGTVHRYVHGA